MKELLRWLLAAGAAVAAFFISLYFSLFVLMFGPFPKDLAEPTAGFTMGLLIVLAGSLLAPRRRLVIGFILCVTSTALVTTLLRFHSLSTLVGGIVAIAFVAWWFHPRRSLRSTLFVGISICVAFFIFIGVVYARFIDRPAHADPLSPELVHVLGPKASLVTAFYLYDRGGFIDHEWLWRIDARPEAMMLIVNGLGLRRTNAVPHDFWKMPPYYWPRSMPVGGEAFQSPMFSADGRGPDGTHYFLVYNKTQNRAFVWVKNNF